MAYFFADSFDLYNSLADPVGHWDTIGVAGTWSLVAGRFGQGAAFSINNNALALAKSSGNNDAVHHINWAVRVTFGQTPGNTNQSNYITFGDGGAGQCSIVFRYDGAFVLVSGGSLIAGTPAPVLATYAAPNINNNTWTHFEMEIVIHPTAGSWTVRKNGATTADFQATGLNTRAGSANNYANRITLATAYGINAFQFDDFIWRSDPTSVPWIGDVRSYTLMPASDASAQFSRSPMVQSAAPFSTTAIAAGTARYTGPFTAPCDCSIGTVVFSLAAGYAGNMKCSIFAVAGAGLPGAVLASATPIANPVAGNNTATFPTPATLSKGAQYIVGFDSDTAAGTWNTGNNAGFTSTTAYASFPAAIPGVTGSQNQPVCTVTLTPTTGNSLVNEPQQDGLTSYVYDATVGHADFYAVQPLPSVLVPPSSITAVVTRGFVAKSDAGTRSAQVQLRSGATTVQSPVLTLGTSFQWAERTDLVDPNTSAAWTVAGVNAAQIGPYVAA